MWYRIALDLSSFWNEDISNDPDSILGALEGVVFDSKKRTDDPNDILDNLNQYKKFLEKKLPESSEIINDDYETVLQDLKNEFPELNYDEEYSGDWKNEALSWLDTPYKFGGDDRSGIDCSAFVQKVFPDLPRTAREQQSQGTPVSIEDPNDWEPGDRIYFDMTDRLGLGQGVADHVGIYLGNNQMIQASSSKGKVTITDINDNIMNNIVSVMR